MRRALKIAPAILSLVGFGICPLFADAYALDLLSKTFVLAIFALSLELLVGQTGLVSLGHGAFMALGAYASAAMLRTSDPRSFLLAFAQLVYYVFHDTKIADGSDGTYLGAAPRISLGGAPLFDVTRSLPFYVVSLTVLIAVWVFLALLARSRFGSALAGIRINEQRMRAAGFQTTSYKVAAFVLAGMIAGLAGFLKASKDGYVNPALASWHQSGAVLVMIVFGGVGRLAGAVTGAFAFVFLEELYKSEALFGGAAKRWQLMFGLTIIAGVLLLPKGLVGLPDRLRRLARERAKVHA